LLLLGGLLLLTFTAGIHTALLQRFNLDIIIVPSLLLALFLATHMVIRFLAPYADPVILPCAATLNGLGVIFIQRIDFGDVDPGERSSLTALSGDAGIRQLIWTLVALVAFTVVLSVVRDHRSLSRYAYTLALVGIVLIAIPAILPASAADNGARLSIDIPFLGRIQPGEFAKLMLIVFFAYYLVRKREVLSLASKRFLGIDFPRGRDMGPVLVVWAASLLVLVRNSDLGTSLMFFASFVVMLYVATERTSWLLIGLGLFAAGAVLAHSLFARLQQRVSIYLDPFADRDGLGYQLVESLFGLGSGGLFGAGPGAGTPNRIPVVQSDFITAGMGEEIGLFGLSGIVLLYMIITERGIRIALSVRDSFGKLLAAGLAFSLGLQVFVIIGGVSKLIPLTGLTTPFMSLGGSSLVANWMLVAVLLRISDASRRPMTPGTGPGTLPTKLSSTATEVVRL